MTAGLTALAARLQLRCFAVNLGAGVHVAHGGEASDVADGVGVRIGVGGGVDGRGLDRREGPDRSGETLGSRHTQITLGGIGTTQSNG